MTYVELDGVRTWYDEHGECEPLVLVHRGGADARAWAPNSTRWPRASNVFTPERRRARAIPEAIEPEASPPEILARGYAELSPDGADHFAVVSAKLARMTGNSRRSRPRT